MQQIKMQFTGWKAVLVLVGVAVCLAYGYFAARATLAEELTEELKMRLTGEYSSLALKDLEGVNIKRLPKHGTDPRIQKLMDASRVDIKSISARGRNPYTVRVEIRVNGEEPPDGKPVRYYKAKHSKVTGWRIKGRATALSYYLTLF